MMQKIFVDSNNLALIKCPKCLRSRRMDLSNFINQYKKIAFRCNCPCGNSFMVRLERRRYPRKKTELGGAFIHEKRKTRGAIKIKNLSLGGVGFELNGNYLISSRDIVLLRFNLDDPFNTLIAKEVEIKKIEKKYIGSEFLGKIWEHDVYHLYLKE